jgi:hypothetical protein
MPLRVTLRRNLLLLLALLFTAYGYSAQAPEAGVATGARNNPLPTAGPVPKVAKRVLLAYPKQVKKLAGKYMLLVKKLKKKYGGDVMGTTILLAILMALGLGAVLYLLAHAGISGLLVTIISIIGFAVIIYWAVKRIQDNY